MTKKLYIFTFFLALLLTGCAMDDWYDLSDAPDRDYAEFNFAVPEPTVVNTRANTLSEGDVRSAFIFFFKDANEISQCELLQVESLEFSEGKLEERRVKYNDALKGQLANANVKIVAVANSDMSTQDAEAIGSLADLQEKYDDKSIEDQPVLIMSGIPNINGVDKETVSRSDLNKKLTINLYRNAAKASVTLESNENTKDFTLSQYALYSKAKSGYLTAGAYKKTASVDKVSADGGVDNTPFSSDAVFGYAQSGYSNDDEAKKMIGNDNRAYVVVEGLYNGEQCFYRVDLAKKGDDGKFKYIFLTPNHHYKITITKVRCKGYASAEEAAKYPMSDFLEVDIYDHVESVMSMTSDGVRELGVTKDVVRKGNADSGKEIMMKLYSYVSESDYPDFSKLTKVDGAYVDTETGLSIKIKEGNSWLSLGDIKQTGVDNDGKVYTIGLIYDETTKFVGELDASVEIKWKGLTREVKIVWERDFEPSNICVVSLTISNGSTVVANIEDYWKFLSGKDGAHKLYGVSKEENNGDLRNQGFHLPLMYGGEDNAEEWTYTYTITPKSGTLQNVAAATSAYDGKAYDSIDEFPNLNFVKNGNKISFTVNADKYSWDYMIGKLLITIDGVEYPFDLYHTGFFHYEDSNNAISHAVGSKPDTGYYYYEVRSNMSGQHWLDRNICATAGTMAIVTSDGNIINNGVDDRFNDGAVGAYILPADYVKYGDVEKNIYENLCPPGFDIPTSYEWDVMRNSGNFITSQTVTNGVPFYQASMIDKTGREVFFPKVMYRSNLTGDLLVGDSNAGYYWTRTAASGIEKAQIGRWMRSLYMSGASNSLINGAVNDYGMQIRAISRKANDGNIEQNTIGFKVKGATHIYIYDAGEPWGGGQDFSGNNPYVDNQKYGLVSWPGQAIGEASTMLNVKNGHEGVEFTFTYTTSTPKENLRVLFAYVENGKIYIFDRLTEKDKSGIDKYNGWPIVDSYTFTFDDDSKTRVTKSISGSISENENYTYRIQWPQIGTYGNDYYRIYLEYTDGSKVPGFEDGKPKYGSNFHYDLTSAPSKDMKMSIYKASDEERMDYSGTISISNFNITEDSYKIFKITDESLFTSAGSTNSYRLYVKKIQTNHDGINAWYSAGISGYAAVGSFIDNWWTHKGSNVGDYWYVDITQTSDFTISWKLRYDGKDGSHQGSMTNDDFTYDSEIGKKCYTIYDHTAGKSGKP